MIIEIINGIHKFLGYLNINVKYLNRGYTLLSAIPILYILKLIHLFYSVGSYPKMTLYIFIFIVAVYFWFLNFMYYFFDKNTKYDITQLLSSKLPKDMFVESSSVFHEDLKYLSVIITNYDYLNKFVSNSSFTNNLLLNQEQEKGPVIRKTSVPCYQLRKKDSNLFSIFIGEDMNNLTEVGNIVLDNDDNVIGLFLEGKGSYYNNQFIDGPILLKLGLKND